MNKVSVQSLNECFNVDGPEYVWMDDKYIQPCYNQPWNKGKTGLFKHTDESKKLITGRPPGTPASPEWRQWCSQTRQGEGNSFYGKTHSEDAKQRIIARHKHLYRFTSPDGKVWEEYTTIKEFARAQRTCPKTLKKRWQITLL